MQSELAPSNVEGVLAAAAADSHPLIDIDWTVGLQAALFFLMFLLANKLLFQPYLALREKRIAGIDGARAEAERMNAEAESKLAEYEGQLKAARNKAAEEQRKIRAEASKHERDVTDAGRKTAQVALEQATSKVQRETAEARAELAPRAQQIAQQMVKQLLGREVA